MKVCVASENPVKLAAVKEAFLNFFDEVSIIGIKVDSGVPEQPVQEETFIGAKNRAVKLLEQNLEAEYFVGVEGGIAKYFNRWFAFGCMYIVDKNGRDFFGTSPHFELPEKVVEKLLKGEELGDVIDKITGDKNSKQKGGAIGFLSNGVMDRKELYISGLINALVPFLNKNLYFKEI